MNGSPGCRTGDIIQRRPVDVVNSRSHGIHLVNSATMRFDHHDSTGRRTRGSATGSAAHGRYSQLFKLDRVRLAMVADGLAELQIRWPNVLVAFCKTRQLAEEWTYRFPVAAPGMAQRQ